MTGEGAPRRRALRVSAAVRLGRLCEGLSRGTGLGSGTAYQFSVTAHSSTGTAEAGVTPYLVGQPTIWAGMQEISKKDLSKAEASKRIDELQERTGRGM